MSQLEPTTGALFIVSLLENKGPTAFLSTFRLHKEYFTREEQRVIEVILKHSELYREIPTKALVEVETRYELPELPPGSSLQFWADAVRQRYTVESSFSLAKELQNKLTEVDIDAASEIAMRLSRILIEGQSKTRVYSLEETIDNILDIHDKYRLNIRESSVPFGLHLLDEVSGGAQGGDLITLAGVPGALKTFVLLHMACHAHGSGNTVLFIPTEMSEVQYHRRAIGLRTNVNVNKIKFGDLSTIVGRPIIEYDKQVLLDMPNKFWWVDSSMSTSMLDVKSAAYVYKPDAIYIDGAYLLRPEFYAKTRYEIVSSVAESLKMLAKEMNIPIFATYQLNKKTEEIYQSAVVRQLSSIVIELSDSEEAPEDMWGPEIKSKYLKITKGRDGEEGHATILLDIAHTRLIESRRNSGQLPPPEGGGL